MDRRERILTVIEGISWLPCLFGALVAFGIAMSSKERRFYFGLSAALALAGAILLADGSRRFNQDFESGFVDSSEAPRASISARLTALTTTRTWHTLARMRQILGL